MLFPYLHLQVMKPNTAAFVLWGRIYIYNFL